MNGPAKNNKIIPMIKLGRGVEYILKNAREILGNPIALFDTSYNLLAHTEIETDDWLWNELTTSGRFSHETVDFFNSEGFIEEVAKAKVVAYLKSGKLKYDRVVGKLFGKGSVHLGNICVTGCNAPFKDGDLDLIEELCEFLSSEIQNNGLHHKDNSEYQGSIVSDLISGNIGSSIDINKWRLFSDLKANLFLVVIDVAQYERTATHLAYFRDLFKKIQGEYKYFVYKNSIVSIVSTDNALLKIERDLGRLNTFFTKYGIYAGISSRFHNILELKKYHHEAISALKLGMNDDKRRRIFKFDNVRLEHFLNTIKDKASDIFSPVVFLVREYDRANNTSLLDILYNYILYGKDSATVCELMKIDQRDFSDQLRKLEDLFDIDWKNGNMLLNLFVSIKMLNCLS